MINAKEHKLKRIEQELEEFHANYEQNLEQSDARKSAVIILSICEGTDEYPKPLPMPKPRLHVCKICGYESTNWQDFTLRYLGGYGDAEVTVCKDWEACIDRKAKFQGVKDVKEKAHQSCAV